MNVLLDMNLVLDVILVRHPWFAESGQVWDAHRNGQITAAIAAFTLPTVFYVVRRQLDLTHAHDAVSICLTTLGIVPISRTTLELARTFPGSDYEDNLQLACAVETKLDALVTRDPTGYAGATIPILTPGDLIARLAPERPDRFGASLAKPPLSRPGNKGDLRIELATLGIRCTILDRFIGRKNREIRGPIHVARDHLLVAAFCERL